MTALAALLRDPAFWTAVLTLSTPFVFGAMGALLCARAGELNFSIAGVFAVGALTAVVLADRGVDPWNAILAAAGAGIVIGLIQGLLTGPLGIAQPLAGIALTLIGLAVVRAGWPAAPTPAAALRPFGLPLLSALPYVGDVLARQTPLDFVAVLVALLTAYMLNRMPLGLAIRACGDNPFAVAVQGRSVHRLRIGTTMAASAMMAIGGAAIVLDRGAGVTIEHVGGRGLLCLALAAASSWRPGLSFVAALVFGALDAATPRVQQDFGLAGSLMAMSPYLLAIAVLAATRRRRRWPAMLSIPFGGSQT